MEAITVMELREMFNDNDQLLLQIGGGWWFTNAQARELLDERHGSDEVDYEIRDNAVFVD